MHLIAYTSVYAGTSVKADLASIVASSQKNNPAAEITGVMFFQRGRFLQFVEGEESAVRTLIAKIESDARHTSIEFLFDEPIPGRGLAQWNMDCFQLDSQQDLEVNHLKLIRDGYQKVLKADTAAIVALYKDFVGAIES